ncbi:hypothetical protein QQF64_023971 [Cirrhinus molitorella]|uniref:Uncharacterized protein n=1 Tax=Cirrhinus molitorella TaxID=172907 RepID=A0ABR3NKV1_9TELE
MNASPSRACSARMRRRMTRSILRKRDNLIFSSLRRKILRTPLSSPLAQPATSLTTAGSTDEAGGAPSSPLLSVDLQDVCKRAAEKLNISWPTVVAETAKSRYEGKSLPRAKRAARQLLPVFPELLEEVAVTWKDKPFTSKVPVQGGSALDVEGMKKKGLLRMPPMEPLVAAHLQPKRTAVSNTTLPSKADRKLNTEVMEQIWSFKSYNLLLATCSFNRNVNACALLKWSRYRIYVNRRALSFNRIGTFTKGDFETAYLAIRELALRRCLHQITLLALWKRGRGVSDLNVVVTLLSVPGLLNLEVGATPTTQRHVCQPMAGDNAIGEGALRNTRGGRGRSPHSDGGDALTESVANR